MKTTMRRLILASLMAALVCIATMIVKIPSPLKGYINLGDCMVLLSGWILPPGLGFLAAGLGSGLADLFAGYGVYIPATFLIKGLMAVIAWGAARLFAEKIGGFLSRLLGGLLAELWMILGYYLFEGVLYGFGASLINIPSNGVQGAFGLVIGLLLIKVFERIIKKT